MSEIKKGGSEGREQNDGGRQCLHLALSRHSPSVPSSRCSVLWPSDVAAVCTAEAHGQGPQVRCRAWVCTPECSSFLPSPVPRIGHRAAHWPNQQPVRRALTGGLQCWCPENRWMNALLFCCNEDVILTKAASKKACTWVWLTVLEAEF